MNSDIKKLGMKGFTLIELLVVVLIIGILAAIAVPQYFKVVEKGKFAESMQYLSGLKGAQERYLAKNGIYFQGAIVSATFDADLGQMKKFTKSSATTGAAPNWTITFTRAAPTPAVYGAYVLSYIAPPGNVTCSVAACTTDLLP